MKQKRLEEGIVQRHAKGFGWLISLQSGREDLFLPPDQMLELLDGDRIVCRAERSRKGPIGQLVRIIKRGRSSLIGQIQRQRNNWIVEPSNNELANPVLVEIPAELANKVQASMIVEVEITQFPTSTQMAKGRVSKLIGKQGELTVCVDRILLGANILREFSPESLKQATAFGPNPQPSDWAGREDLQQVALCTIDGETAKDFDDAVFAEMKGNEIRVIVAIADVAHYVSLGSPIDLDAYDRGTSLYYPGHCIPMIPEQLSNGLCSLVPKQPRLCMAVEIFVSTSGHISRTRIFDAVMNSHARLTYNQVQTFIDGKSNDAIPNTVHSSLSCLLDASRRIRALRVERGAIDFDIVESLVALDDDGEPVAIHPESRLEAHRLIEDLMVATNEIVAEFLVNRRSPGMFRVHEEPDAAKLGQFLQLAESLGLLQPNEKRNILNKLEPKDLAGLRERIAAHPAKQPLESLLLRSMMQARYSSENLGHFGLASTGYLHFTSPIRRYPDLVVHRLVRQQTPAVLAETLEKAAIHLSACERKATDVERKIASLYAAWILKDHVGEEDDGLVSSCTDFGLFVRLSKFHVEGLVHIASIGQERLNFDPLQLRLVGQSSGVVFAVGDVVRVRIDNVSIEKMHIDLSLVKAQAPTDQKKSPEKKAGKKARSRGKRR